MCVSGFRVMPRERREVPTMTVMAYIALGSNIEPRQNYLDMAGGMLAQQLDPKDNDDAWNWSSIYETAPGGGPSGRGAYLNAVVGFPTDLPALEVLDRLREIETELRRVRLEYHGPRTIDLDLLLYGDLVYHDETLTVPHPRLHERLFVLQPLAEI